MNRLGGSFWAVGEGLRHMKERNTMAMRLIDRRQSVIPRQNRSQVVINCPRIRSLVSNALRRKGVDTEMEVARETMQTISNKYSCICNIRKVKFAYYRTGIRLCHFCKFI